MVHEPAVHLCLLRVAWDVKTFKTLWIPFAIILWVGISAILFLPLLPIDETRSLSVAWEMWLHKSFIVPLLNGVPYTHKPPLLFWLIHLSWWIFGVNEITPRLIPMLFSMGSIFLVYRISLLLWPDNEKTAKAAALLLSSTLIWMVWSFLILYEMLLSFWVLVCVFGVLSAYKTGKTRHWLFVSLGIAGGILTKGPVILVHVVPLMGLVFWWGGLRKRPLLAWYAKGVGSLLFGLALSALWVVPAVIQGGEAYRHALLWRQTAERVVDSFAHRQPAWWYFPILPILFLPWVFAGRAWQGLFAKEKRKETGWRVCVSWFLSSLVIFSFISGKQVYYLIPSIPAVILLIARNVTRWEEEAYPLAWRPWGIGIGLVLLGVAAFLLPMVRLSTNTGTLPWGAVVPMGIYLLGVGVFLLFRTFDSSEGFLRATAVCVAFALSLVLGLGGKEILKRYDLKPLARQIKAKMDEGNCVAYIGAYHGEFQFLGRLKSPLVSLKGNSFIKYLKEHPDCVVIDTLRKSNFGRLKNKSFCYIQPFREERVIFMLRGKTYLDYFLKAE